MPFIATVEAANQMPKRRGSTSSNNAAIKVSVGPRTTAPTTEAGGVLPVEDRSSSGPLDPIRFVRQQPFEYNVGHDHRRSG